MHMRKVLLFVVLTVPAIISCGTTHKENITSNPSGADIYWGYNRTNFVDTEYVTPFQRSLYGKAWESRCYQARKEGYLDSEVICKPSEMGDRHIHFDLRALAGEKVEKAQPAKTSETDREMAAEIKQKQSHISEDSHILLSKATKEELPSYNGPAAKYIEKYLKDRGHSCYVEIIPSLKSRGKFAILINRYFSEDGFDRNQFTEVAIIGAATLSESVSWDCSDLFLDYAAYFEIDSRHIGWATISVADSVQAKRLLMSTNDVNKFTAYWKSRIRYISDTDPEPIL
ncbi:MAG: hypothetical protein IMF03_00710 [Proteobacteria bacterium]|nr:hypothetical protein [Pseudomonadota bacterium]